MSQTNYDPQRFRANLEVCLEKGPESGHGPLEQVSHGLSKLLEAGSLDIYQNAIRTLADALRTQRDWQLPFLESGIFGHVVQNLNPLNDSEELTTQYLRVIGNCVADNDETRKVAVDKLEALILCLERDNLRNTALAVIFNLCNDYDLAQERCAAVRLDHTLTENLASGKILDDTARFAADLIGWATEKLTPVQIIDPISVSTFGKILDITLRSDEDIFEDYIAICIHYLENEKFRKLVVADAGKLLDLGFDLERRLPLEVSQNVFKALRSHLGPEDTTEDELSIYYMVKLINSISAISASDSFVQRFSVQHPSIKKLISKALSMETSPLTVLACVVLGNLTTSDQTSLEFVQQLHIHLGLLRILSEEEDPALLYAAAGFMRHLAIPEENKQILGSMGLVETCCHLLSQPDPSVRGEAAAILGKLVTGNLRNIERIVYTTVPEDLSPFPVPNHEPPENHTLLYYIVTQAVAPSAPVPSTSMKNAGIEIGRFEISILRSLGRASTGTDIKALQSALFKTPLFVRPVARLVQQRFFSDARSEGLLGLGLMVQSEEGAACVVEEMKSAEGGGLLQAIKEFALSQKGESGKQVDFDIPRDPHNAIVLLHGLETNGVDVMGNDLKRSVDSLRIELERLVLG